MKQFLRVLLLLLAWTALGRTSAWAITAAGKSATVGVQNGTPYTIPAFSSTVDALNTLTSYRFETIPAATAGIVRYPSNTNGTGTAYTTAAANASITPAQAANLQFVPAAGSPAGTTTFTYTALETLTAGVATTRSAAATYSLLQAVGDAQTSPVLANTGQKAIPALTAGTTSPTNYRILALPGTGTLYVNGTAASANQLITAAQAAQLAFTAATGYFGTTSFTYAPADAAGDNGDAATYAIPVTTATCSGNNSVLDFSRRIIGDDWMNHASVAVNASNVSSGSYSSSGVASGGDSFLVDNNAALPGPSLAWRQVNTGYDPAVTPNTATVTFTFDKPVTNLSLSIQDIDKNINGTQSFTDELTLDGYSTAASTTPIALAAGNIALASTNVNQFIGNNTIQGTANSDRDAAGNVVVTFTSPVQRLTLTFKNTAPYTAGLNRTHTVGITSMTWCRLAPVANDVTTATLPSTAGQVGISSLSSTVDGSVTTYTIATIPNATTQGTLYYNSTGTTYAAVAAGRTLTAAQAASLRFAPVSTASGNATFTYTVQDDNGLSSNTATYTIPVNNTPCSTATATFSFGGQPAGENWQNHAATPVPTGSGFTTVSTSGYTVPPSATANTFAIGTVNGAQTLQWSTDYANQTDNTSSVTFTFNRPVSNFAMRVQDIDSNTGFTDQVVFTGANGGTAVTPVLGPLPGSTNASTVAISGNTATGTVNNTSTTNATVLAYFSSPITTLTLTYRNISTTQADPGNNTVGIDLLQFCRLAPVANAVTNPSHPSGQGAAPINSLSATADGTVASYTITALPAAAQGTYYVNGVVLNATNFPGLVLTPTQATQLSFAPAAGFSGNAGFSYFANDDAGVASNTATYTVPVTATGAAGTPAPCATPGKDGAAPALSGVVNTYFAGTASVAAKSSATSISVAASVGAGTGITPGDLLLVIQMQGADLSTTNDNNYGANNASGGGNLSNANFIAGTYEYVVATSSLAANTAGPISVAALVNSYSTAPATSTAPRQSYQVVRIPQYTSLTLGGQLNALAWNGSAGGILAIDVAGTLNLNNQTLSAVAAGFRGGAGFKYAGAAGTANTDYRTSSALTTNATKGEGTAGTPRYTLLSLTAAATDNSTNNPTVFTSGVVNGYPNGDNGKGAPGNAGGGGTDDAPTGNGLNDGGGGGANGGAGGLGGWPRNNNGTVNTANQAVGGVSFAPVSSSRLVMGGGGGAGTSNDGNGDTNNTGIYSSGAPGGGLILVRTGSVSGTGTANASGDGGYTLTGTGGTNDGGGGGGAGGTVLFTANTPAGLANLTVLATGGKGTVTNNTSDVSHGPGGGGGGGVVLANGALNAASSVAGGAAGTVASSEAAYNGTTYGAVAGATGVLNTQISSSVANSAAGTTCVADVATTITGPASATAGQATGNYTATFSASTTSGAANVTQTVTLPTGAGLTSAQQSAIKTAYPATTFATTGTGSSNSTTINFGTTTLLSGAANAYVFAYTAPTTTGSYSTTSTTSTTTNEASQTANNSNSVSTNVGVGADVTVSLAGPTTLNAGQPTGNFTATFTNEGPGTATSVARQVTLPTGASLTVSQQATIVAAYADATFSTTGSGASAVTTIDFGAVASLASNAVSTVQFAFTAPDAVSTNLTMTGTTSTTASEGSNAAPNQTTLTLSTVTTADVVATISGATSVVNNAATGTFNVSFSNRGPQTADGVTRTVQLPTGLTGVVVSGSDAGTYNSTTGLVTYSTSPTSLTNGAALTSTITFPIPTTGGQVAATASVGTTTNEGGLTTNNTATAVMPASYDLMTTISGPVTAVAGSPMTLYVTTTNNGPNTVPTALQTVSIPSSAPLTNVYITNGGTYSYNNTTKIGTVTFPDPANPTSGVTVANLPSGQTIANSISFLAPPENFAPTATVQLNSGGMGTGEMATGNNTANLNNGVTGNPVVVNTNTSTLATANESTTITTTSTIVSAGTAVTYQVAATNHGPGTATNVIEQVQLLPNLTTSTLTVGGITGTLSSNGATITYTSNGSTVATYSTTTGIITYATVASQLSGTTQGFGDIMVTVPASTGNTGQLLATANVRTGTNDPVPADNVSAVAVKVTSAADLATTLTGPTSTTAGQTASYTVAFTNNGTGAAGTVAETMQLPAGLSGVVVQDPSGNVIAGAYSSTTGLVTFPAIASDAVGATQVYNVAFAAPGQSYSVSSSIGSGTTDNTGANNSAALRTAVTTAADVAVAVSGPATATAGNALTYAVTTFNNGPGVATGVAPSIQLPLNLTNVTAVGGTYDAGTGKVTFNSYNLAANESRVSLVTFTMPTSPANGFITGAAAVTTTSSDLVTTNNTAALTTSIAPATPDMADLVTSITASATTVVAGSPVSYTIKFRNNTTTTPALNVVPTAYLPAGLTGVVVKDASGTVLPNAYNSATGQIIFPTIASQSSSNTPDYNVSFTAPSNAGNVLIVASATSSSTSDPTPGNNAVGNTVNITASYDVVTSLTGPATALPGSTNTYSVMTTNNGPSTATAATSQTVTLPSGVTATNISGGGSQSGNVITFPNIASQPAGANGAVTNTFSIVMPAAGSLVLSATVASANESNTTNDGYPFTTTPTNQVPVAENVWNTLQSARGNTANLMATKGLPISPLYATDPDGEIASYTITSIPDAAQGVLYYNGAAVLAGQVVAASGLSFAPASTFVGNATFTYTALDKGNAVSNIALYTIPVAKDLAAVYTTYNSTKGGSGNKYVNGDVLAQVVDANTDTYTSAGLIYDATTGALQSGAANGLPTTGTNATLTSGTLPSGVSLDPATGRLYVSDASQLTNTTSQTYTVTITTVDSNGGVTTQPVSFIIGGSTPLPVVLAAFTASAVQNRDALLTWSTASEVNNDHFEVERSFDGTTFAQLGRVAGHGTTTAASAYQLLDAGVAAKASGAVYYRLRQVDYSGTATYSPVRTVSFTHQAAVSLSLYPNPAQASTQLDLSALPTAGTYQVLLLDATGRTVRQWTLGGGQVQPLDVHELATGAYLLRVSGPQPDGSTLSQTLRLTKE